MGPCSDEHGNETTFRHSHWKAKLQWGRALMSTEIGHRAMTPTLTRDALQWGRALMSTEINKIMSNIPGRVSFNGAVL